MTGSRAFLDSNVLVYAFDADAGGRHETARALLENALEQKHDFAVALQNVNEFFSCLTKKKRVQVTQACLLAEDLLAKLPCYCADTHTADYALTLVRLYKIPYWDALIAALMLEHGIFTIYTENEQDFRKIPGIKVINPFRKK